MKEPTSGELNKRVRLYDIKHVPLGAADASKEQTPVWECWCKLEVIGGSVFWDNQQTDTAISHRIFVRTVRGKSRPQDLPRIVECVIEGIRYRSKRVTDCNAAGRFTLIEAEVLNASSEN